LSLFAVDFVHPVGAEAWWNTITVPDGNPTEEAVVSILLPPTVEPDFSCAIIILH
jgi:hypothetical protein